MLSPVLPIGLDGSGRVLLAGLDACFSDRFSRKCKAISRSVGDPTID